MLILSITGLFKTILILIGVFVLLRFIGQLMIAKRNLAEQQALKQHEKKQQQARQFVDRNKGKTTILPSKGPAAEDVDYEEV